MNTQQIIATAEKHAHVNDSAALCLRDAKSLLENGDEKYARSRALDSLMFSVGCWHEDYKAVAEVVGKLFNLKHM